jgi:uncharacterized protein DUF1778
MDAQGSFLDRDPHGTKRTRRDDPVRLLAGFAETPWIANAILSPSNGRTAAGTADRKGRGEGWGVHGFLWLTGTLYRHCLTVSRGISLDLSSGLPDNVCMAKDVRLDMRVSQEEKELFQQAADRDNRPLSNWIRDRLTKAARAELANMAKGKKPR